MYNANIWWHFFQFSIFMMLASLFVFKVFEHKLRISNLCFWVLIILYTAVTSFIISLTLTEISPHRELATPGILIIISISITTLKVMIRKHGLSLFFLFFLFLNIQLNTLELAKATLEYEFMPQPFEYLHANTLLLSLLYVAFLLPILYSLLVKLYKRMIDENISFKGMEFFCFLPAGFFFSLCFFMRLNDYSSIMPMRESLLPLITLNICAFGSYFAVLKSVLVNHDAALKHEELYAAKMNQLLLEEQCESLQSKIASEARARHDWRHHIITIIGFVDKQDLSGLECYLTEYKDKYLFPDAPRICNVDALDMLFQYYKRKASELDITLTINTIVLDISQISVSDLIVVFGNLLANAMESCERMDSNQKYLTLKIKRRGKNVIAIICENNFDGIVLRKNNAIISRKKEGGIGLSSIETVVEKNNGVLQYEISDKIFKVYVALHI